MNFLKKIFGKKNTKIENVTDFWNWFITEQENFHKVIKEGGTENITENFFQKLEIKLDELKPNIKFLTGMLDDGTADLILTADGYLPNFYIIEELIAKAPKLENWLFQAHKPAHNDDNFGIAMEDIKFDTENISFYTDDDENYPDEINLVVIHEEFSKENEDVIKNGSYIFLENYVGEVNFATMIDNVDFISKEEAAKELIPLTKLNSFLTWREKEFVEKYEATLYNTDSNNYSLLQAELKNGNPLFASVNQDLLEWDAKASHPWILEVSFEYTGNDNGLPNEKDLELMNTIEDELCETLKDSDGYLFVCRETSEGKRYLNFACKDYIQPSKEADKTIAKYQDKISLKQELYKDKYWRSFERFMK